MTIADTRIKHSMRSVIRDCFMRMIPPINYLTGEPIVWIYYTQCQQIVHIIFTLRHKNCNTYKNSDTVIDCTAVDRNHVRIYSQSVGNIVVDTDIRINDIIHHILQFKTDRDAGSGWVSMLLLLIRLVLQLANALPSVFARTCLRFFQAITAIIY